MQQVSLGDTTRAWVLLDADQVTGHGQVAPRLSFQMRARTPRERMSVEVHILRAELEIAGERLGQGFLTGVPLAHGERPITVDIPVNRAGLDFLQSVSPAERIDLELRLTGWLRARDNNEDAQRFVGDPQPGEWVFQHFGEARQTVLAFQVARSDWFTRVLQPIGTVQYISAEITLPAGDPAVRAAAAQLSQAESAYAQNNDPSVFLHCRAAIDALPGAKQDIFAALANRDEAKLLDDLLRQAGQYLHHGRHVATAGDQRGSFPVDHHDARFALNLTKLLIAHTSRVLSRS
jgi:hypothetical protein